eukprot:6156068-Pleurochrysis_carterae.AAC.1
MDSARRQAARDGARRRMVRVQDGARRRATSGGLLTQRLVLSIQQCCEDYNTGVAALSQTQHSAAFLLQRKTPGCERRKAQGVPALWSVDIP